MYLIFKSTNASMMNYYIIKYIAVFLSKLYSKLDFGLGLFFA